MGPRLNRRGKYQLAKYNRDNVVLQWGHASTGVERLPSF